MLRTIDDVINLLHENGLDFYLHDIIENEKYYSCYPVKDGSICFPILVNKDSDDDAEDDNIYSHQRRFCFEYNEENL